MSSLARCCWPELAERHPLVLLPLGACEQHGPHLPLHTDTTTAAAVAEAAAEQLVGELDVLVAPAQPYAASGEHEDFPGTVSTGRDVLASLLVELGRSLSRWAPRVVVVNAHGGNHAPVQQAMRILRDEGREIAGWHCAVPGGDAHAGRTETSLLLELDPGAVRTSRAEAGRTEPLAELLPALGRRGVCHVSPNGVLGDPAGATAQEGRTVLAELSRELAAAVRTWTVESGTLLAPVEDAPRAATGRP